MARAATTRSRSRGATLVEYALIISLFVFGSLGAISNLNDSSGDYYENASDDIGDLPQADIDLTDEDTIPSGPPTSVPPPPSSTSSTSTSTTTTTVPTTTTQAPNADSYIADLEDISYRSGSTYYARPRVRIRNSQNGNAVSNATVYIYLRDDDGAERTTTCQTSSTGRCSVTWSRSWNDWPVLAYVYHVNANPTWDGQIDYIYMSRP